MNKALGHWKGSARAPSRQTRATICATGALLLLVSLAASCAPPLIDRLQGHWAETTLACRSDGSFIIEGNRHRGEGGSAEIEVRGDTIMSADGFIDVYDVRVSERDLIWRDRGSGEVFVYVRCASPR